MYQFFVVVPPLFSFSFLYLSFRPFILPFYLLFSHPLSQSVVVKDVVVSMYAPPPLVERSKKKR